MQFYLLIQATILLLIRLSVQDELTEINRINRMRKLTVTDEDVISKNELIDSLVYDLLPDQTPANWSPTNSEQATKLEPNENDRKATLQANLLFQHTPEELIYGGEAMRNAHIKANSKTTRKKVWKKRTSKLMNKQKATSAMPYSSSATSSASAHQNTANKIAKEQQDTTRYVINTYSSVSYNPPHHHLQYKQINIKPTANNQSILDTLPSTMSLSRFNDVGESYSSTTENDKLNRLYSLIDRDEQYQTYHLQQHNYENRKYLNNRDLMTTPISISMDEQESNRLTKVRARRTKFEQQPHSMQSPPDELYYTRPSNGNLLTDAVLHRTSNDVLEHHLLSSFGLNTRDLLDAKAQQNKAKNQVELRLNRSELIKINWPVKKAVDLAGDISLGGLMMIHERDENYICGQIMPQGGIQVS